MHSVNADNPLSPVTVVPYGGPSRPNTKNDGTLWNLSMSMVSRPPAVAVRSAMSSVSPKLSSFVTRTKLESLGETEGIALVRTPSRLQAADVSSRPR